ncbi:hypothetical protein BDF20DRAFT_836805 [Mycotypha africana]|uniref:uncharacterized protein n=1 Tax=Mycotypha africana TaxID=64632 RepID=UPI002300085F|nr:uncharacterized protein BDF20DRAFT_836805 [Mycotypha africana]KAI8975397.1 hypothetical protein BDF20DRAFT_836805 [Mycotypha africana]
MGFITQQGSLTDDNLVSMDPLFEQLLDQKFATSTEAYEYCKEACAEYGFTIKQEPNINRNIYIYCTHMNQQSSNLDTPPSAKRSSALTSSECQWKIVLVENENNEWVFRNSLNPMASEHNHKVLSMEGEKWPQKVQDKIIELARQQKDLSSNDISQIIKMQFSKEITWNNRLFYNYLTEERRKNRQQETVERVQRLITATTRLCSVVAANEDWATCVEGDLSKMLQNYKHLSGIPNSLLDSMVDLQMEMIYSEIETRSRRQQQKHDNDDSGLLKSKKRKAFASVTIMNSSRKNSNAKLLQKQGFHVMNIPSCALFVRSQPLRSVSDTPMHGNSSGSGRRQVFPDMMLQAQQPHYQPIPSYPQMINTSNTTATAAPFNINPVFHLTSPISSTSSTSSTQQRLDYHSQVTYRSQSTGLGNGGGASNGGIFHSPPITDSTSMIITPSYDSTVTSNGSSCGNNTIGSQHQNQYSAMYPLNSYSPYTQPNHQSQQMHFTGSASTAPEDIGYPFNTADGILNCTTTATTPSYAQVSQTNAVAAAAAAAAVTVQQHRQEQQSSTNMATTPSTADRLNSCYSSNTTSAAAAAAAAAASLGYFSAMSTRDNNTKISTTIPSQRYLYQQQGYDQPTLDNHQLPLHTRSSVNHSMTGLLDVASTNRIHHHHHHPFVQQHHHSATALSHQAHPSQSWT